MRAKKNVLAVFCVVICCSLSTDNAKAIELKVENRPRSARAAAGELIIEIKQGVVDFGREKGIVLAEKVQIKSESLEAVSKKHGLLSVERLFSGTRKDVPSDIYVFRFSPKININEAISSYKGEGNVIYAEPNYTVSASK